MTDRECLEQLIKNLDLKRIYLGERYRIKANEYVIEGNLVFMAWGEGEYGCDVTFRFDKDNKIISHAVTS